MLALTGCVSVTATPDSGVSPPFNVCPTHPCTAYSQTPAPICNGGACLVSSLYSNLLLVVSLAEDSDFAPGQSLAIPYGSLNPGTVTCAGTAPCAQLPGYAIVQGAYTVQPQVQLAYPTGVGWNLGNPGQPTALPIHVTYRPLVQPGPAGTATFDATSLGLPLDVIPAFVVVETAPSSPIGPAKGPSIGFQANLQANWPYEATFQPDPPFDAAFPPEVETVTFITTGTQNDNDSLVPDPTLVLHGAPQTGAQIPSFSVYRVPDGLAGWQTYLRHATTRRRVSSVGTLGTRTNDCASTPCTIVLPTNYHPADGDALTGAEIVIVPPASLSLPTYVAGFLGGEFLYAQHYPVLPPPLAVNGSVTAVGGTTPVEADLYFEVTQGNTMEGIYTNEPSVGLALNATNFEYTAKATALIDPSTNKASYSISLPPGAYSVTVRPLDAMHQVTTLPGFDVDPAAGAMSPDLQVDGLRPVLGSVLIKDERPMAGALVEAVPAPCTSGATGPCVPIDPLTMPREAQTTTAANGAFDLTLDPGSYLLRIQPQDGTLFPWVTQPLLVGPTAVTVPAIFIPAPVHAGVELFDPYGNPVVHAVVRVYQVPASGPAIEVGRALTDETGTYDLYLAPSSP
jgi:hypothetical protein